MAFTAFRGMKPFPQLMFSIFVIIISFLFFLLLSVIVAIPFFGANSLFSLQDVNNLNSAETINMLKFFQIIQSAGLFIVPSILLAWLFYGSVTKYLHLNKKITLTSIVIVVLLMFAISPLINFIGEMNTRMQFPEWLSGVENWMKNTEEEAARLTEAFLNVKTIGGLLFNLFMIAFLPAIGEELLFRGVIQRILTRMTKNHHWGIWISAALFSALHMQFYGFVPRLLLGALFGYLLIWSGSMWLPIIAHLLNNGIAVVGMYLIDTNRINPKFEQIGSYSDSYYLTIISFFMVALILWQFKNVNRSKHLELSEIRDEVQGE